MNLKQLRQRLHDLKAEGRQAMDKLSMLEANENPSDVQLAEIVRLNARIDALHDEEIPVAQAELERAEAKLERERSFAALQAPDDARIEVNDPNPERTFGFHDIAEFALAVRNANPQAGGFYLDERLARYAAAPSGTMQESGATSGEGYMVPPEYREAILEVVNSDDLALLNMVDSEPTNSNSVELLADETTPWGSTGIQANWRSEKSQMTPDKLQTTPRQVRLYELYAFAVATDELLSDAPRLANRLINKAGLAIRWKADDAIMWGDGSGKPLGFMEAGALVTVAKETSQAAATVNATNVSKMYSRLMSGSLRRARWFINSDVLPQLMTMSIANEPVWFPDSRSFQDAPGGLLLGRPVIPTEHSETVGTVGDIVLIDPMGYYLSRKRSGVKFDTSIHLYFDYGLQAFRWTFRLGGQPYLSAPVSPARGSNSKSHFVALATRA